jgi:hypothetical protein
VYDCSALARMLSLATFDAVKFAET